jgi:hypothetical protein
VGEIVSARKCSIPILDAIFRQEGAHQSILTEGDEMYEENSPEN